MSQDTRCPGCNKLLMRDHEIKCPRCKELVSAKSEESCEYFETCGVRLSKSGLVSIKDLFGTYNISIREVGTRQTPVAAKAE